jgi:hypothetical protein
LSGISDSKNWESKFYSYFSVELATKSSLFLIVIFTVIVVLDSVIVKFSTYGDAELTAEENIYVFIILFVGFAAIGTVLLNSVNKGTEESRYKTSTSLRFLHRVIIGILILNIAIILFEILQMLLLDKFAIVLTSYSTYLCTISSLFFLGILLFKFLTWVKKHRNFVVILFAISIILLSVCILISVIYLEANYARFLLPYKKPYPLHLFVTTFPTVTSSNELLTSAFDFFSVLSFIVMWVATILLLKQYQNKIGKIRYSILVCIPLIYYLFPFESYFGNIFSPFMLNSPITFTVFYVLIFSATKQVGALLFSLAFISSSVLVVNSRVRRSILISAIGITFVFGSTEIATLQYILYPPYGMITQSFLPLGSYLLFIGIYNSAVTVSRDTALRKEFYKSAKSQLGLLKTIGVTEMEKELEKKFKTVEKHTTRIEGLEEYHVQEEELKEIMRDVLKELYSNVKNGKANNNKA